LQPKTKPFRNQGKKREEKKKKKKQKASITQLLASHTTPTSNVRYSLRQKQKLCHFHTHKHTPPKTKTKTKTSTTPTKQEILQERQSKGFGKQHSSFPLLLTPPALLLTRREHSHSPPRPPARTQTKENAKKYTTTRLDT
jgi:hypothetical protein